MRDMNMQSGDQSRYHCHKAFSWKAVIAGALIAIGLTFLFNLLTLGLGFSMYTQDPTGRAVIAFLGFAWMLIGSYLMLFAAGWVVGKVICRDRDAFILNGFVHGFLTWSLYAFVSLITVVKMGDASTLSIFSNFSTASVTTATNTEEVRAVGLTTLASFLIFLSAALGCSFGAMCGVRHGIENPNKLV